MSFDVTSGSALRARIKSFLPWKYAAFPVSPVEFASHGWTWDGGVLVCGNCGQIVVFVIGDDEALYGPLGEKYRQLIVVKHLQSCPWRLMHVPLGTVYSVANVAVSEIVAQYETRLAQLKLDSSILKPVVAIEQEMADVQDFDAVEQLAVTGWTPRHLEDGTVLLECQDCGRTVLIRSGTTVRPIQDHWDFCCWVTGYSDTTISNNGKDEPSVKNTGDSRNPGWRHVLGLLRQQRLEREMNKVKNRKDLLSDDLW